MRVIISLILIVILIPSCSVQKRKYTRGYYVSSHRSVGIKPNYVESTAMKPAYSPESMQMDVETVQMQKKSVMNSDCNEALILDKNKDSILVIDEKVGEVIDSTEKIRYKLFPSISNKDFVSAQFKMDKNGKIRLDVLLKDGSYKSQPYSLTSYENLSKNYFAEKEEKRPDEALTDEEILERKLKRNSIGRFFLKCGLIFFHFIGAPLFIPLLVVNSLKRRKLKRALDGLPPEEKKQEADYIFQKARKIAIVQLIGIPLSAIAGICLASALGTLFGFGFDLELAMIFAAVNFYIIFVIGGIVLTVLYFMIKKRLREDPYPELSIKMNFIKIMLLVTLMLILIGIAAIFLLV